MKKPKSIREQLTARQWADICEFFESVRGMARNAEGRKRSQG